MKRKSQYITLVLESDYIKQQLTVNWTVLDRTESQPVTSPGLKKIGKLTDLQPGEFQFLGGFDLINKSHRPVYYGKTISMGKGFVTASSGHSLLSNCKFSVFNGNKTGL